MYGGRLEQVFHWESGAGGVSGAPAPLQGDVELQVQPGEVEDGPAHQETEDNLAGLSGLPAHCNVTEGPQLLPVLFMDFLYHQQ